MAKLLRMSEVGIFTRDQKLSRTFYTRKIGMKVRSSEPKWGYLALGVTKGGVDASLSIWQPDPAWGSEMYDAGVKEVGTVTGIGFATADLKRTTEQLSRRGVKIELEGEREQFARFWDPDGNTLFLSEDGRAKARRVGIRNLDWVTVVTRDAAKAHAFFTKALSMRARKVTGESFREYRLSPKTTAIVPFVPTREMYDNPADYDADMAHVGEETGIAFLADDTYAVQEKLLAKGVRFKTKAEEREWGSIAARIYDPDGNSYMIYTMKK
ncbi:MAG: VOC family protein [Euryarchaeota archaeon]|nr:VOC family protein [Euryarchaeota archaeon]